MVSHHAYTNLETPTERNAEQRKSLPGKAASDDADLALSHENDVDAFSSFPVIRMHPHDKREWFHRYQHLYAPLLFGTFTLVKIFESDAKFYRTGRVAHVSMASRLAKRWERAVFLGMKALNVVAMVGLPAYLHGARYAATMLFAAHFTAGEYLATVFIVSHISEACDFFTGGEQLGVRGADPSPKVGASPPRVHPRDWAALQARSTVNWASESWLGGALSGGLNTQFEHHVFPGVNSTAYRHMAPVVRETCREFGVPYNETGTLWGAIALCWRYLRDLGRYDDPRHQAAVAVS